MCLPKFVRVIQRRATLDGGSRCFHGEGRGVGSKSFCRLPMVLGIAMLAAGCGETYRPVVTPVPVTGPAPQPQSYAVVTTTTGNASPGLANIFDGPGDTLLTQALISNGPLSLTLSSSGTSATAVGIDGTVNTFTPSTTLQTKNVQVSTLLQPAQPVNLLATSSSLFITEPNATVPSVAVLTSSSSGIFTLTQQLSVPASPINLAGNANAARVYSITQDNGSGTVAFGDCESPSLVTTPGQVQSIEISTVTISRTLPVGICPVYGLGSTDNNRVFILNRGSGTITVINSQLNEIDTTPNLPNITNGTLLLPPPAGVAVAGFNAGPVFADYFTPTSQLVTANYDSNTITIISTSIDQYGNDSSLFGQAVTVPVGNGPAALTILRDGSRVYVANQKDSTVSVVSLTSFKVLATIPVTGHPISIASTFSTPYGQVFVLPSDQPYMSVIRTDTDQVAAAVELDGNGVDVHTSAQSVAANSGTTGTVANAINVSHASGSGAPCGYGAVYYQGGGTSGPCSLLTDSLSPKRRK